MGNVRQTAGTAQVGAPDSTQSLVNTLLRVAWMSILLGLVMQSLLVLVRLGNLPGLELLTAEMTQKIAWPFIVCAGLAVGAGASKVSSVWTGLAGLIAAPLGFNVARSLQKSVSELLGATPAVASVPDPLVISTVRGLEYLWLGLALVWLGRRIWGGIKSYIILGLLTGIVFGSTLLAITPSARANEVAVFSWAVNELLFPVGCALIIFASEVLGTKVAK